MEAHQQRVVDEKNELDSKFSKLSDFIAQSPIYKKLPSDEQERLLAQHGYMAKYSRILGERIAAF